MLGGDGEDILAWKSSDLNGGVDAIKGFTLDQDYLRFDDLFANGTLDNVLAGG